MYNRLMGYLNIFIMLSTGCANNTTEQEQPQYPTAGRSDIPTQDTIYTIYIIITPQQFTIPHKEIREQTELSIICM
jgi:hypothetical protein